MWPRCKNCKHVAECHASPNDTVNPKCDGDGYSNSPPCNCLGYELPDDWKYDESGNPVRK